MIATVNKVFYIFFFVLVIKFALSPLFAQDISEENLEVVVGIDKVEKLNFSPSTKIELGNEKILTYTLIPDDSIREITLKGLKPGKTSVIIRDKQGVIQKRYRISVTSNDLSKIVLKLREFFQNIEGVKVGIKGGSVVVEGEIIVPKDIGKIAVVLKREEFKDVLTMVELSPQTQRVIARKMQEEIHRNGIRDISVRIVNSQYWLEGFVTKESDRKFAEDIAYNYLPDKLENLAVSTNSVSQKKRLDIVNFVAVNPEKAKPPKTNLLKFLAQFIELSKDYQKVFGFKWTPILSGNGGQINFGKTPTGDVETNSQGTFSGIISNLFPKLNSAKEAGNVRVLQQGMVVVKEGVSANISKGVTKKFSLGTGDFSKNEQSTGEFKVAIEKPAIEGEDNISFGVNVTISFISPESQQTTFNNSISTALVIKSRDTGVIGGVAVSDQATSYNKNPPFGADQFEPDDPKPLFSFIRSKSYVNSKSQYAVFVTPEILATASQDTESVKRKFLRRRR